MDTVRASMLVIGDEILSGFVEDTNSTWFAQRLQPTGMVLDSIVTVPDEIPAIDKALQAELSRARPRLVVTTGGVGSTPDDLTYEAVAASLGRDLVEHPLIAEWIEASLAWQAGLGNGVSEDHRWHMLRMARVPAGGQVMSEEEGPPAVRVDVDGGLDADGATIVLLPGVPSQFQRIVDELLIPHVVAGRNVAPAVVKVEHGLPESALNPTFARIGERFPDVKLGSYPGAPMLIRLSGPPDRVEEAATFVRGELDELLATEGGAQLAAAWSRRMAAAEDRSQ